MLPPTPPTIWDINALLADLAAQEWAQRPVTQTYLRDATASLRASQPSGVANVLGFGADPTGSVDSTAAIQAAINSFPAGNGTVYIPRGTYKIIGNLLVQQHRLNIVGDERYATQLLFAPIADGTCLKVQLGTASPIYQFSIRNLLFYSADSTFTKTALEIIDASTYAIEHITVGGSVGVSGTNYWSGGTGSIGVRIRGREAGTYYKIDIAADRNLLISPNPNGTISIDHHRFTDLYLTGNGRPCVEIETGVNLTNVEFDGDQAWVKGSDGLKWIDTTTSASSVGLSLKNVRWEQATGGTGWTVDIEHNTTLTNFYVENMYSGAGANLNGVKLRKVNHPYFVNWQYAGTLVALDTDSIARPMILANSFWQAGSTSSPTGLTKIFDTGQGAGGGTINGFVIYDAPSGPLNTLILAGTTFTEQVILKRTVPAYGVTPTIDASLGNKFDITPTDGAGFTILNPTNATDGQRITITIKNTFGVLGVASWQAKFKMPAWVQPANGFSRSIDFQYDGTNWIEVGRTGAFVPFFCTPLMADDQVTIRAATLARLRTSQQIEFQGGRSNSAQSASWRTEFGSEVPSGSVANASQRLQQVLDQQHGSWQVELGDPAPSFYGDAQFQSARDLIAALGGDSVVVGFWDYRYALYGLTGVVDAWGDIRGGNSGALVGSGSGRPVVGSGGLTFNGTSHFLRATSGMSGITGSCALVMVVRGTSVPDRREWELSIDASTSILSGSITSGPGWTTSGLAVSTVSQTAPTASARILHARRTVTVDVGTKVGSVAEVTAASANAAATANRLTLGGSRADTPALFAGLTDLKAVILIAGVYSAGQVALINAWAQAAHGAVLTN